MNGSFGSTTTRAARFVAVGIGANLLLFILVYFFRRSGMPAFAAGVIAYGTAFMAAYYAQQRWTFEGTRSHRQAFPRYLATQCFCLLVSSSVAHASVVLFSATPFWTATAFTAVAGALSYILSSQWVFRPRSDRA